MVSAWEVHYLEDECLCAVVRSSPENDGQVDQPERRGSYFEHDPIDGALVGRIAALDKPMASYVHM